LSEVDEIIKDFEFLESWEDKYQMIIDMGKSLPELDDMYMNDNYRLKGCQSTVYFVSKLNKDKTLSFKANSDAFIVKGLIALILKVFNNKSPSDILTTDLDFLKTIGLDLGNVDMKGDNGKVTVEVSQFGGRFGKDLDGSDLNDDGISHRKEGGLKLEVSYETLKNGSSKVFAKLV